LNFFPLPYACCLDFMAITVSIVEDNDQLRGTLARMINRAEGFACLGQYPDAESALSAIPKERPQVVLMDINLPGMNGVECVRKLKQATPEVLVVMLTVYEDTENIFNALAAGAAGYMLKRTKSAELLAAIREVVRGGSPMTTHIARKVVQSFLKVGTSPEPTGTGSVGLPGEGFSLQGNRGETGHQLRDGAHLRPPDL
jgi:DNA-binding NarL/FixJ family response regulator